MITAFVRNILFHCIVYAVIFPMPTTYGSNTAGKPSDHLTDINTCMLNCAFELVSYNRCTSIFFPKEWAATMYNMICKQARYFSLLKQSTGGHMRQFAIHTKLDRTTLMFVGACLNRSTLATRMLHETFDQTFWQVLLLPHTILQSASPDKPSPALSILDGIYLVQKAGREPFQPFENYLADLICKKQWFSLDFIQTTELTYNKNNGLTHTPIAYFIAKLMTKNS
jgi:hypothetical protein